MIVRIDQARATEFLAVCDQDLLLGADIRTQLAVYGPDPGVREADFWLQTDDHSSPVAALCRENGRVMVSAAPGADPGELAAFLQVAGGFNQIRAEAALCDRLDRCGALPGAERFSAPGMRYPGGYSGQDPAEIADDLTLDELFALLCVGFPGFENYGRERWFVYASHLFRHGLGNAVGIRREGRLVCTAGIYGQSPSFASIACVATDPAFRGGGHAARLVRCLCDQALAAHRTPTLLCAEERLADYYGRLGFAACGRWGKLSHNGKDTES